MDLPIFGVYRFWLGFAALAAFLWEGLTGLMLLMYYDPGNPYSATVGLISGSRLGEVLLATHLYGAYLLILLAYAHGALEFLRRMYRRNGAQWVLGVLLFALTILTAYFGYVLTGDVLAIDAVNVGVGVLGSLGLNWLTPVFYGQLSGPGMFIRLLGWHIALSIILLMLLTIHHYLTEVNVPPRFRDCGWPQRLMALASVTLATWGVALAAPSALIILGHYVKLPILASPLPGPPPTSPQAAGIPPYPPWFLLYMYKLMDAPLGLTADVAISTIVPLAVLLSMPLIRSYNIADTLFLTGLTWLILYSAWGALSPGEAIGPLQFALATAIVPPASYIVVRLIRRFRPRAPGFKALCMPNLTYALALASVASTAYSLATEGALSGLALGASLIMLGASLNSYRRC